MNEAISTTYMPAMRVKGGGVRAEDGKIIGQMDQVIMLVANDRFVISDIENGGTTRMGLNDIKRLAEIAVLPVREQFQRQVLQCAESLQEFWNHQHKDDKVPMLYPFQQAGVDMILHDRFPEQVRPKPLTVDINLDEAEQVAISGTPVTKVRLEPDAFKANRLGIVHPPGWNPETGRIEDGDGNEVF